MTTHRGIRKQGRLAPAWGLLAVAVAATLLALETPARAESSPDVTLYIDGEVEELEHDTLAEAIAIANAIADAADRYDTDVEILLNDGQLSGGATGGSLYFLNGAPSDNHPTVLDAGSGGFNSVAISRLGSSDTHSVGFTTGAANRTRVLEIINVSGEIALDHLSVVNGGITRSVEAGGPLLFGGAGLYLGAASGTDSYPGDPDGVHAETIGLGDVTISGNKIDLTVNNGTAAKAVGGGVFVDGTNYAGKRAGSAVSFGDLGISGNSVKVSSSNDSTQAFGGGFAVLNASSFTFGAGTVSNNSVSTANGLHAAGGGGAVLHDYAGTAALADLTITDNSAKGEGTANAYGGGLYSAANSGGASHTFTLSIADSSIKNNKAVAAGDDAFAGGGGVYSTDTLTVAGTEISGNSAEADDAAGGGAYALNRINLEGGTRVTGNAVIGTGILEGAGLYSGARADMTDTVVDANWIAGGETAMGAGAALYGTATVSDSSIEANLIYDAEFAYGGGVYAYNDSSSTTAAFTMKNSEVLDNLIHDVAEGMGGGLFLEANASVSGSLIAGNEVTAVDFALGGGVSVRAASVTTISGSEISGNLVEGGTARGAGLHVEGTATLTDTDILNNTALGDIAQGGGIYVDTSLAEKLTLATTANGTATIHGNSVGGLVDGQASGVHFGTDENGGKDAVLEIRSQGALHLLDPVIVDMRSGAFTMTATGSGRLDWGGANTFDTPDGATITLSSGATFLAKDFTAVAAADTDFSVCIGASFGFDGDRDFATALFTFADGVNTLDIDENTNFLVDMSAELQDVTRTHLFAEGYDNPDTAGLDGLAFVSDYAVSTFDVVGTNVYITTVYESQYRDLVAQADPNTWSALDSGALSDLFHVLSHEERADLAASSLDFNNATPGWFMNNLLVARETIILGADAAVRYGLGKSAPQDRAYAGVRSGRGLARLDDAGAGQSGPRFWSGYVGDFERMDSHSQYYGYKSDRHGFVAGINYDVGHTASIGLYGGYTHTKTKARGITAQIKSDTGHVGVIGRISPLRALPEFTVYADAGYTFSSDDTERGRGAVRTTGDFETNFLTAALELEYEARLGCGFFAPYASIRYVRLKQDEWNERGALAAVLEDIKDDAGVSRVGLNMGYDIGFGSGVLTPSLNVAWRHDFGDRQYHANAFYQGVANPIAYTVRTTKFDRDSLDAGVAIRTVMTTRGGKTTSFNLGYNLNLAKNRDNHSLYAGFELSF